MADLTPEQTLDMLADLAAGALNDVFTQAELQRLFDRAVDDYSLAVYYGWRQIAANASGWVDYQVAQTKVSRSQAYAHIKDMLTLWGDESRTTANQLQVLAMNPVPPKLKPVPADETFGRRGFMRGGRWFPF